MKILVAVLLFAPLLAQDKPLTPVPSEEQWLTGSIDLGYRWNTGVGGSYETYRSIVNLGSGPKLLGADFSIFNTGKRFFDRIDVRASGWGGDPYSTFHLTAKKSKLYNFNADYRNIAYFNNLPSFADPGLARGIALNQDSYDTRRKFTSLQLDLLPGNWFVPYLAFDRDTDTGSGVNAFVAGGNEYPVPTKIRDSVSNYRGGVRLEFQRFHVTLEQGGTVFKDDQNVYVAGGVSYGNNPTPLLGQTLDLTSLWQAYGIRGTGIYSKGLFTASVASWIDLYAQFLYSRPGNHVNYQQFQTGSLADVNQLLFFSGQQYLLSSEAKAPHTSGSIGAELRPFRKIRVLQSWLTDRLSGASSASSVQTTSPAGVSPIVTTLLGDSLATNYSQEQLDIIWDIAPKLTLRGGYRYAWGDASDVILPIAELAGLERGRLRQNTGIAGAAYRPLKKLSLTGEVSFASSDGAYFRTSLYNYQKLRIRARYQLSSSLRFAFDANLLNNHNPTPGINYSYLAHDQSLSLDWAPKELKGWSLQGSYTRSTVRSNINYLIPETLQSESDLYRDNNHNISFLLDGNLPPAFGKTARLSVGGSFFLSSGSRPTNYYQPFAKVTVPVRKQIAWVSEWRYYGFAESFYVLENFRAHLIATGVTYTR